MVMVLRGVVSLLMWMFQAILRPLGLDYKWWLRALDRDTEIPSANKEHETETFYVLYALEAKYIINGDMMGTEASKCRSRARTCNASTVYILRTYNPTTICHINNIAVGSELPGGFNRVYKKY